MNKNIKAELILASKNQETNDILYTFLLTYPRIILAEVNTHTIASKNTASSRAIPTKKVINNIFVNPFIPSSIGQYQSGMVAGKEIDGWKRTALEKLWEYSRYPALASAKISLKLGAPKQFTNRLLEPWMITEQIWSATDVENEMLLRHHPDAEPHYEELAKYKNQIIRDVQAFFNGEVTITDDIKNRCQVLNHGEWHLPFVRKSDWDSLAELFENKTIYADATGIFFSGKSGHVYIPCPTTQDKNTLEWKVDPNVVMKLISCARCAWVSYEMPGEDSKKMNNLIAALSNYEKLIVSSPRHLSPTQHVAAALPLSVRCGNLRGFLQHRKEIDGETGGDKETISVTADMAKKLMDRTSSKEAKGYLIGAMENFVRQL